MAIPLRSPRPREPTKALPRDEMPSRSLRLQKEILARVSLGSRYGKRRVAAKWSELKIGQTSDGPSSMDCQTGT